MSATTRQVFLQRVRWALSRTEGEPLAEPAPTVDPKLARLAWPSDDLLTLFTTRAKAVGMHVQAIESDELRDALKKLIDQHQIKRLALGVGDKFAAFDLPAILKQLSVEVIDWTDDDGLDQQFDLDAGITDVAAALAETGTLIAATDPQHGRGESLVPPTHIALVRAADVLPDLLDYYATLKDLTPQQLPSSVSLITGPSKTADIEGILVTGVHGPGAVHILLLTDA